MLDQGESLFNSGKFYQIEKLILEEAEMIIWQNLFLLEIKLCS